MALKDYKEIVGTSAGITTILQIFSGVFVCIDIVKQRSTKNVSITPFLGGIAIGILMLNYSLILGDSTMINMNVFGILISVAYTLCYYVYSHEKVAVLTQAAYASAFVAVLIGYTHWESKDLIHFRFGMILTVLFLFLMASPLFSLGEIMRTKSTATLPFPMIISGTVVQVQWLLYGIIIEDLFTQVQNGIGLVLSLIQLSLFVIYPNRTGDTNTEKKEKKQN